MPLTPEQIEHIERIKKELGIDQRLGTSVSQQTHTHGHNVGIDAVSPDEGRKIVHDTFNPVIKRVIAALDG